MGEGGEEDCLLPSILTSEIFLLSVNNGRKKRLRRGKKKGEKSSGFKTNLKLGKGGRRTDSRAQLPQWGGGTQTTFPLPAKNEKKTFNLGKVLTNYKERKKGFTPKSGFQKQHPNRQQGDPMGGARRRRKKETSSMGKRDRPCTSYQYVTRKGERRRSPSTW